jgi:hypothetical protein
MATDQAYAWNALGTQAVEGRYQRDPPPEIRFDPKVYKLQQSTYWRKACFDAIDVIVEIAGAGTLAEARRLAMEYLQEE